MSVQTNKEAFCLANTYGLCPPRIISKVKNRIVDTGKYEPDRLEGTTQRTMTLAHWIDHTNILVKYNPVDLEI